MGYRDARVGKTAAGYGMETESGILAPLAASKMGAGGLPAHFTDVIMSLRASVHGHRFTIS